MVLPDGAPVAVAARLFGAEAAERVTGSDLFDAVFRRPPPLRHFFYGSSRDVLDGVQERVADLYPDATVVGAYSPPFRALTDDERREVFELINRAAPDVVWVGLGAPRQDLWMAAARPHLDAPVLIGVGAVFDFVSGRLKRAPALLRRYGLEWVYRLIRDPRRLWRRYLVTNMTFVLAVTPSLLRGCRGGVLGRVRGD
jgi:N-acetylglucosaminyldiphosphoundecaprenol N-acetyl-beta-D-mannosaminyltransferase